MRCKECGTENPAGQKFCGGCATPLTGAALPALPADKQRRRETPARAT